MILNNKPQRHTAWQSHNQKIAHRLRRLNRFTQIVMYFRTNKMIFKIKLETPGISLPNYVIEKTHNQEENTMEQFLNRHKDTIYGVISGFDRVLFRGTLRSISHMEGMRAFLPDRF
ncbi:MAG TPA: hypothetical protein ACFYEH_09480 [Candidatus Brocadiaceae bacterium]